MKGHAERRPVRLILAVFLMAASLVAPSVAPEHLPFPAVAAAQAPPASNQAGTPADCPTVPAAWTAKGSECVIELPVCPQARLGAGFARMSSPPAGLVNRFPTLGAPLPDIGLSSYPNMCEERVLETADPAIYATCRAMVDVVVETYVHAGHRGCRLLYVWECPVGLHRAILSTCWARQRRGWDCPAGYAPGNKFNTCYQMTTPGATHPACGTAAPGFPISACADYVASDFYRDPTPMACDIGYPTATPVITGAAAVELGDNPNIGTGSAHWCSFDAQYLMAQCHRTDIATPAACVASTALCLKRPSRSGGCDSIADTIRCRAHEAAYAQGEISVSDTRNALCEPCLTLPFEPSPAGCSADITQSPTSASTVNRGHLDRLLNVGASFAVEARACVFVTTYQELMANARCRQVANCADPPAGRVQWHSHHHSRAAVINSPVLLQLADVHLVRPPATRYVSYNRYSSTNPFWIASDRTVVYASDEGVDRRFRLFLPDAGGSRHTEVRDYLDQECIINGNLSQAFRVLVTVEELMPDTAGGRDEISRLFGTDALDWWTALTAGQQQAHIESRGLAWMGSGTATAQQIEDRRKTLITEIECQIGMNVWCRWIPTRHGYFKVYAEAAWRTRVFALGRRWGYSGDMNRWLGDSTNRDRLQRMLANVGLTPAEAGLRDDLTGPLPQPSENWLYSDQAPRHIACPSIDVRVYCGNTYGGGNYTVTAPVGIAVHEVRVHTVRP